MPPLDATSLTTLLNTQTKFFLDRGTPPLGGPAAGLSEDGFVNRANPELYDTIVAMRSAMTATPTKANRGAVAFVNAFDLGVNMAIAEAQSTGGPEARLVVVEALAEARTNARSLQLDLAPLEECIQLARGSTPLPDLHTRILSVRTAFQTLLGS